MIDWSKIDPSKMLVDDSTGFKGPYLTGRAEHVCERCGTSWITERGELQGECPRCSTQPQDAKP